MQIAVMALLALTLLVLGAWLPALVHCCDVMNHGGSHVYGAHGEGDLMFGLLAAIHGSVNLDKRIRPESYQCSDFELVPFMRSLATVHAIEEVNAAGVVPGLHLGYMMFDTCSHASKALQNVELMLAVNHSLHTRCDYTDYRPRVKGVLGPRYSETSISVAKLLSIYMILLLSSTSSSPALSDKTRYPNFIRTVPSDVHQTRALTQLMVHFSWNWVGVVYRDDDYGKAALQSFLRDAQRANVCVAYQEVLPFQFHPQNNAQDVQQVTRQIRSSSAQVVLLILKSNQVEAIFKEMIKTNTKKIWLASDSWAVNGPLAHMEGINKVGDILGFSFISSKSESFDNYLKNLRQPSRGYNHFIEEYKNLRFNCTPECFEDNPPAYCPSPDLLKIKSPKACEYTDPQAQNDDFLVQTLDTGEAFLERGAVWAIAHALKKLLECNGSSCTGDKDFPPWKLLEELKRINFEYEGQKFYFDENGDSLNGYDVIMWTKHSFHRKFSKIGRYRALDELIQINETDLVWFSSSNSKVPFGRCAERCPPGKYKKILKVSCCYQCIKCKEGKFTDGWDDTKEIIPDRYPMCYFQTDHEDCKSCPEGTWCLQGADHCKLRWESYLRWNDAHPIAILAAAVLGFLLLLVILVLFWIYRDSSAIKRAEVSISTVMIAGLSVSYASVLCFMGKPSVHLCRARQVMYALGFTLCVSCVLVKAYRTFLAFLPFGRALHGRLTKLYQPAAIIIVLTILQGIICCLWLIFDSPDIDHTPPSTLNLKKVIQCHEGTTYIGFGIMLSYIALLAFIGFLLAFKGRKVPQQFSETGYIIFSMLMYLFVWVCFVPVFITRKEERTAVQASAILVSNYGIIFCHFLPKCYEAIWGPDTGTMERFYNRIRAMAGRTAPIAITANQVQVPRGDIPTMRTISENTNNASLTSDPSSSQNEVSTTQPTPADSSMNRVPNRSITTL